MKTIACLAAALAAITSLPAAAQGVDRPAMDGVWVGTVGNANVHACFDWREWRRDGQLSGVYYYDRYLDPIRLRADGEELAESVGYSDETGARWRLDAMSADTLTATFMDDARQVPIRLHRVDWQPAEFYTEACASEAFLGPRFEGGRWVEEAGWFDGQAITTTNWIPPEHFTRSDDDGYDLIGLNGLQLVASQPGDGDINRQLAQYTSVANAMDCMASALTNMGVDGDWSVSILPEVITERWLGTLTSSADYCGGAHPNYSQNRDVFDRRSGAKVETIDWFSELGFTREWHEGGEDGEERFSINTISPKLLDIVLSHWTREDDPDDNECREINRESFGWNIGLVPDGLAFMPLLPHVAMACAETLVVPWDELAPYLSAEGRLVAADNPGS